MIKISRIIYALVLVFILYASGMSLLCLLGRLPAERPKIFLQKISAHEAALSAELRKHVAVLAVEIGDRNHIFYKNLTAAAAYIAKTLAAMGYTVMRQEFTAQGKSFLNLIVERRGATDPEKIILIAAHYDCAVGSPGADDNGSGIAALLALARAFAIKKPGCTVRFAFFPNEEPPFFWTEAMGSFHYARLCRANNDRIHAMLALEMLGFYSDEPGSQHYIFPLHFFFPATGDFIGFVSNLSSRSLLRQAISSFRRATCFPAEGLSLPWFIPGIFWSDHWPFWKFGYPAIMVTDTAFFRNPHYHEPTDLPATLDYERMARVTAGLELMVEELAKAGPNN